MKQIKKVVSVLLTVGMVLSFAVMSHAADIDLSGYSDDEILALNEKVQQEIAARGIVATAEIVQGSYTAGKDLPAGRYDLTLLERDTFSQVFVTPAALVGTNPENTDDYSFYQYFGGSDVGKQWSITLEDGDVLEVQNCKVSLTISTGVVFK